MAEKINDNLKTMTDYKKYEEQPSMSRTSNYNETVRANNNRIDQGRGDEIKRLPKGKTASRQWKGSKTKGRGM